MRQELLAAFDHFLFVNLGPLHPKIEAEEALLKLDTIIEQLDHARGMRIFDIGCGDDDVSIDCDRLNLIIELIERLKAQVADNKDASAGLSLLIDLAFMAGVDFAEQTALKSLSQVKQSLKKNLRRQPCSN